MERIPILRMGDFLLVTIQVDMHDRLALQLQDDLTNAIAATSTRGVLIDISSLDIVDSFIRRMLANIAAMARVLDAATVLTGMRPAVAITLVELGLELPGVRTALNVERGMALLRRMLPATPTGADTDALPDGVPADDDGRMHVLTTETLPIRTDAGVVAVRRVVRERTVALRFTIVDQTKLVTAASELARNVIVYGGGGTAHVDTVEDGPRRGLRVRFEDEGPGIAGVSSRSATVLRVARGLGLGLGGAKRLVQDFDLDSAPGRGTRVAITRWL